ncbi:MAG: hypothetical protein WC045_02470 [Patescibacteria group bacterium]
MANKKNTWLLLDFSTAQMGVGIFDGTKLNLKVFSATPDTNRKLVAIIQKFAMQFVEKKKQDKLSSVHFSRVGVVSGPGTFTGLRTAAVIANSIAFAMRNMGEKFDGIVTVDSLVSQLPHPIPDDCISVIPAGRDEVYLARYTKGKKVGTMTVVALAHLGSIVEGGTELVGVLPHYQKDTALKKIATTATKRRLMYLYDEMMSSKARLRDEIVPEYGKEPNITIKKK